MKMKTATLIALCGTALLILGQIVTISSTIAALFTVSAYTPPILPVIIIPLASLLAYIALFIFFLALYNNQK